METTNHFPSSLPAFPSNASGLRIRWNARRPAPLGGVERQLQHENYRSITTSQPPIPSNCPWVVG
jgi:hypothetical protein